MVRKRRPRGQELWFFANLPRCLIGIEACATAHYWAREYVKAYMKRNKNDAADADAICKAGRRPSMQAVKTAEQQAALLQHRGHELLVGQRTMLGNALRGHLAEFSLIAVRTHDRKRQSSHHKLLAGTGIHR